MHHKGFDEEITEMRSFGELLMPYNFPLVTQEEEECVNHIKLKQVCVDGYNLILHYSKSDYGNHFVETLQILGKYCPFLPFFLVCKIGKKVLGNQHLSLVEVYKDNRKIYCWTLILDKANKPVLGPYDEVEYCTYEGFEYRSVNPNQLNLR